MEQVFRYRREPGYQMLVGPGQAGLTRLELGLLRALRDEEYGFDLEEREAVLVILSGRCTVEVDGESWDLERVSAFAERPMAVYVPRHRRYSVVASKPTDLAIFTAEADQDHLPRGIGRHEVVERSEGFEEARRQVYTIVGEGFPASHLLVGETHVAPGHWASYPPHKHDTDNYPLEVGLEEAAFYQVDPPQGFGLQYLYTPADRQAAVRVVRNDEALAIVRGYHPLAAAPGYRLCYLWGLAGEGHVLRSSLDPEHAWVAAAEPAVQPEAVAVGSVG